MINIKKLIYLLAIILVIILSGCSLSGVGDDTFYKTASVISNNNRNIFVSEDEEYIFFTSQNKTIEKMSKKDGKITEIFSLNTADKEMIYIFECFKDRIYILLSNNKLISIDNNGQNILEYKFSEDEIPMYNAALNAYIYDDKLYFIIDGNIYHISEKPLGAELNNDDKSLYYVEINGKKFYRNNGKLYRIDSEGSKIPIHSEENIITNRVNFTDYYIFYISFTNDMAGLNLYRMNLDGNDKILIKSIPIEIFSDIKYDNKYIYVETENGYFKINKETFEEINLSDISELNYGYLEVVDERFFQCMVYPCYYIDTRTGEKVIFE